MISHRAMLLGLVTGCVLGLAVNRLAPGSEIVRLSVEYVSVPIGQVFLRLLFMLVIPLLVSALVLGICDLDLKHLGRIGVRMLGYTVVVSSIAVAIGVGLVELLGPGRGLGEEVAKLALGTPMAKPAPVPEETSPVAFLVRMVPDNPLRAAAEGDMLAIIVSSILFGIGLAATKTEAAARLREVIQGVYDVTLRIIGGVLRLAPLGVAALLYTTTARLGIDALRQVAMYVATVLLGLGIHMFGVYSLSVWLFGRTSPRYFFRATRDALLTAFSTASSNATLPTALKVADENLRLPRYVSRLVLTAGASMNQNGTALFEGVTVLFLAQVYGVSLSVPQELAIVLICILAGIGTAGVPAGSLPVIAMILGMVGVPPEGLGLVLGVDRFLDMCRTTINVAGDLAAAVFVARGEPDRLDQAASDTGAEGPPSR